MNSCVKCFLFLVVAAVLTTYLMVYTSSGSTESELFSVSDLVKKTNSNTDHLNEAINQYKDNLNDAIKQHYNTISEDNSESEGSIVVVKDGEVNEGKALTFKYGDGHDILDDDTETSQEMIIPNPLNPVDPLNLVNPVNPDPIPIEGLLRELQDGGTGGPTSYTTSAYTTTAGSPTSSVPPGDNDTGNQQAVPAAVDTKDLLEYIHLQCNKLGLSTESPFDQETVKNGNVDKLFKREWPRMVIGSYEHRLMYSSNPKCGSTSFKKFLIRVHGDTSNYDDLHGVHNMKKHESDKQMKAKEQARIIAEHHLDPKKDQVEISDLVLEALKNDFYYVGFIRNPFTRLISGFRDKVLRRSQYLGTILADIGKPDPTDQEKFYSFVKLLFQKKIRNLHFNQQYEKMKLCTFPYNLLGQVETTDAQIPIMLKAIGLPDFEYPGSRSETGADTHPSHDLVDSFFGEMPTDILNMFYEIYKMDFELMGYSKLGDPNFPFIVLPPKQS